MTKEERGEMHDLAVRLVKLTSDWGDGWAAMQYMAIDRTMEELAKYCAVCDCQKSAVRERGHDQ